MEAVMKVISGIQNDKDRKKEDQFVKDKEQDIKKLSVKLKD